MYTFPPIRYTLKLRKLLKSFCPFLRLDRISFKIKGYPNPIHLRPETSDVAVVSQILFSDQFKEVPLNDPTWILDCGANIGCSAVYFLNKFPECKVVCVEADYKNFAILVRNLEPYLDRCFPFLGAISTEGGLVSIESSEKLGNWGSRISSIDTGQNVPAFPLQHLCSFTDQGFFDLIKMDIEGGETGILNSMSKRGSVEKMLFKRMIVECHSDEAFKAMSELNNILKGTISKLGEYTMLSR